MTGPGVEALGGLGEAEQGDLLEVVEVDAAVAVAAGDRPGDADIGLDEVIDQGATSRRAGVLATEAVDDGIRATDAVLPVGRTARGGGDDRSMRSGGLGYESDGNHDRIRSAGRALTVGSSKW